MTRIKNSVGNSVQFFILTIILFALPSVVFARGGLPDFTDLVEKAGPAVVNISTIQKKKKQSSMRRHMPEMPDMPEGGPFGDWFKHFFGEEGEGFDAPERNAQSLGSGFIISKDGYILTNNHVIEDAEEIIVRLSDRRELNAELIGRDERSDMAVLKVKAKDLPVVKLGSSKDLKVGEWVLAIGSPFGFDYSVTSGIVSAKGRALPRENYVPFIQTDVAINPGNSGGPLFNLDGEVVGINSQIYSRTGGYMGVSFAIPIDIAMIVVDQLKEKGKVDRGWLGVLIQDVTRELAESFDMDKPHGALVARVLPDSPAEAAGFNVGDVIIRFNNREIDHSSDLPPIVGITPIDIDVPVDLIREGKRKKLTVKIGALPDEEEVKIAKSSSNGSTSSNRIGVVVDEINEMQRDRMELNGQGGVLVKDVKPGPAHDAAIRRGDVILMINNIDIKDPKHFAKVVDDLPKGKSIPVLVHRRGSPIFLAMKVDD